MDIHRSTRDYETWLSHKLNIVESDLHIKHQYMRQRLFYFFRATFYRWSQLWLKKCEALNKAPEVLAVGDLHVDNFGSWRDIDGRLVWGVNDFDEAAYMPYTIDLVRLCTSAMLAIKDAGIKSSKQTICNAVLDGYMTGLLSKGKAIVLGEHHHWLWHIATSNLQDPQKFWHKIQALEPFNGNAPKEIIKGFKALLPSHDIQYRLVKRTSGIGSLGRERIVAVADWQGAKIAREAKALAPSAFNWAKKNDEDTIHYQSLLDGIVRSRDPFVRCSGDWLIRRIAPDCSRIELSSDLKDQDRVRLLFEMGRETANIHLCSHKVVKKIVDDVKRRPSDWLTSACTTMLNETKKDWLDWKGEN